jgi:putative membrane protein
MGTSRGAGAGSVPRVTSSESADAGTPPAPGPGTAGSGAPDDREAEWSARPLDPRDYSRRTHLANERTFLAWWRTGLTALAAALAAARVVPELADAQDRWPYTLLGIAAAVAGVVAIAYGHRRRIEVEEALLRGDFPPASRLVTGVLTGLGVLIGAGMLVLVVLET